MAHRGIVIAVEGASAAGKSSVVRAARAAYGWSALSEAFDRLDPRPSLEFASSRELLATERRLLREEGRRAGEANRGRARGDVVVADTGFWGPLTYAAGLVALGRAERSVLVALGKEASAPGALPCVPDLVVYLDASAAARHERARRDRAAHPAVLEPRHAAVGAFERSFFVRTVPSVLPGAVRRIRALGPPEGLAARLRRVVDELPGVPGSPPEPRSVARAVVSALLAATARSRGTVRRVSRHR